MQFRQPEEFSLVMGTESLTEISLYTLQYDVLDLAIHEAFDFYTLANNIALIFINDTIPWNWPTVRAIPLRIEPVMSGVFCSTTGWNFTDVSIL